LCLRHCVHHQRHAHCGQSDAAKRYEVKQVSNRIRHQGLYNHTNVPL
jgi:hypothetical protein